MFENTPSDYEGIGEAGQRTLNALHTIVANAQSSTETQMENTFKIETETEEWLKDEEDENYVSKIYSINSAVSHADYEVSIDGDLPEGAKLTTLEGTETKKFSKENKFKIMLPKDKLDNDGKFTIDVKTEVKVKPVIYGGSPDASWQNYALTAYMYEDSTATYEDTYKKIEKPKEPEKPEVPTAPEPETPVEEVKILPVTGM